MNSSAPAENNAGSRLRYSSLCLRDAAGASQPCADVALRAGYRDLSQSLTSHQRSTGDKEERNLLLDEGTCITDGFRCRVFSARSADGCHFLLCDGLGTTFSEGSLDPAMVQRYDEELCSRNNVDESLLFTPTFD